MPERGYPSVEFSRPLAWAAAVALMLALLRVAGPHVSLRPLAIGVDALIVPRQGETAGTGSENASAGPHGGGLPTPLVLGYYYGQPGGSGFRTLERDAHLLTGIIPDWYTIWRSGQVTGAADAQVVRFARQKGLWDFALVQQNQYGGAVLGPLLRDPVASRVAMDNLLALCEENGFDGINLDFEGVPPADRARYSGFVAQLASLLHRSGYYLTLSVPAETADEPQNGWTGAYDYRALGRAADLVMVMAYDEHYAGSNAGPIAATGWVESVVHYAAGVIPSQKLLLGVPLYGYDWGTGFAQGLSYQGYRQLAVTHGASPTAPAISYWQGGVRHQAYYEGLQAFEGKVRVAIDYSLRGIALWRLGLEDPRIWDYLGGS